MFLISLFTWCDVQKISSDIIVVNYSGVIDEQRVASLVKSINTQIEISIHSKLKGILVSLKTATYNTQKQHIIKMIKELNGLSVKLGVTISLIDYTIPLYQILKSVIKPTRIKLFINATAARLFLDKKAFKSGMSVLVYDNDEENKKQLASELAHFGYTVIMAKDYQDYKNLTANNHYDVIVTYSALNINTKSADTNSNTLTLSRDLIANLPVFMDTAVETLVSFTGLEAKKSSHSIKRFNLNLKIDVICAIMHFKGSISGSFVLVFPKDIAIIAMESLLGEHVDSNDTETILDGVGEFCNIITGSTKTALAKKDVKVLFDLPKKFTSLQAATADVGINNGIWIDMQLAGKPFYMFITK